MANLIDELYLETELLRREMQRQFFSMFTDDGSRWLGDWYPARRDYAPHIEFLDATARYREVCMMASNRSGKTQTGAYAITVWLTGQYPPWWTGKRFGGPVQAWAAGKTNETARDIIQRKLFGDVCQDATGRKTVAGTGMVPGECLIGTVPSWRSGIADTIDTLRVRHVSGEWSLFGLKSYQQGVGSYEGTAQHAIWLDEEPPLDIATECLTRTATTNGVLLYTFTPLLGVSDVARRFLPGDT